MDEEGREERVKGIDALQLLQSDVFTGISIPSWKSHAPLAELDNILDAVDNLEAPSRVKLSNATGIR